MATTIRGLVATTAIAAIALGFSASADPITADAAAKSLFNGMWSPDHRPPGGPGGPGGPNGGPGFGPPPQGAGFGPPPGGGRGFGPPPGGPGGGPGRRGAQVSVEDQAKGLEASDVRTRAMMTDAGKAKFATYDPLMHPTSNCRSPGLPSMAQIPELQEWKVSANGVDVRYESYGMKRTVHLNRTSHPSEAHSTIGHAFGTLAGDTLTIETANLSEEWGGLGRSAPGSDQRVIKETYRLVDKDTIEGFIEIRDPKYLNGQLRMPVTLKRQPAGTEIVEFPCDVEVAQRDFKYIADGLKKD